MANATIELLQRERRPVIPAVCEERDIPPFRPIEIIESVVDADKEHDWRKVDLAGITDLETRGAFAFTTEAGLKQDVIGGITLRLPCFARVDEVAEEFPAHYFVKDASSISEAFLTEDAGDAVDGSPTYVVSGMLDEENKIAIVDSILAGGAKSIICRPTCAAEGGQPVICAIEEGPINQETPTGEVEVCVNGEGAPTIAKGKRCEGIHYSSRRGGEPYILSDEELSSLCSGLSDLATLSSGESLSSDSPFRTADYELVPLECS